MNTFNQDPNFSIVMRGGCNAKCSFCFNKSKVKNEDAIDNTSWLLNLYDRLRDLPKQFYQISITGNEPMISPNINNVLILCGRMKGRFTNILLTTNGTNLLEKINEVSAGVHHINISRHHFDENENKRIFGGTYNIMDAELENIIDTYSARGIDVSLNCVIDDKTEVGFIYDYIDWAKRMGAYAIRFRKQNGESLDPTPCEEDIEQYYHVLSKGECPVCRTWQRVIRGMNTYWKAAVIEPSDIITNVVYELVYDTDGKVYMDWNRQKPAKRMIDVMLDEMDKAILSAKGSTLFSCGVPLSSHC